MLSLRINQLVFAARSPNGEQVDLDPGGVLVLVGPNNAGKSTVLRETENWCSGVDEPRRVLEDLHAEFPDDAVGAMELLERFRIAAPPGQVAAPDHEWLYVGPLSGRKQAGATQVNPRSIEVWLTQREASSAPLRATLLRPFTVRLDGHTRFELSNDQPCGDVQSPAENHIGTLFRDGSARRRVRGLTAEAFPVGPRYFVIEFFGTGNLRVRMGLREPDDEEEEQSLSQRARDFHAAAPLLADQGDGVRAFTGLISAVVSLPHRVLLIDEPEAFLHPTLARRLGNSLATLAAERESTTLIAASHSAEFLMGCIDAGIGVNVVRLTFDAGTGTATARHLPAPDLRSLMTDPLLRSTGALDGLFHRAVVVAESDADRAFYDEINHRLVEKNRGVTDAMFANAQNWQTIARIIGPLRELGIPAAGIMDLDAVQGGGTEWKQIFRVMHIDEATRTALQTQRSAAKTVLDRARPPKRRGVRALSKTDRVTVMAFTESLARHGIFVVPVGELEGWLANLGVQGPKSRWIVKMFQLLGKALTGRGDVWAFIDKVADWLDNPARTGLPG